MWWAFLFERMYQCVKVSKNPWWIVPFVLRVEIQAKSDSGHSNVQSRFHKMALVSPPSEGTKIQISFGDTEWKEVNLWGRVRIWAVSISVLWKTVEHVRGLDRVYFHHSTKTTLEYWVPLVDMCRIAGWNVTKIANRRLEYIMATRVARTLAIFLPSS